VFECCFLLTSGIFAGQDERCRAVDFAVRKNKGLEYTTRLATLVIGGGDFATSRQGVPG
jgi:hypothetical protein